MQDNASPTWAEMRPAEFDASLATRRERKFIAEAPATLFPRLLPDIARPETPAEPEMPGQGSLFGDDL